MISTGVCELLGDYIAVRISLTGFVTSVRPTYPLLDLKRSPSVQEDQKVGLIDDEEEDMNLSNYDENYPS